MDFWSYDFWSTILSIATILTIIVFANILRRKIGFLRKSFLPSALIAGIIALIAKTLGLLDFISTDLLDMLTYHAIAIGFIALALKKSYGPKQKNGISKGVDSGAIIVGTYIVQAFVGLLITLVLAATFLPDLFSAAGVLLPLGFGQGTGQASNFGTIFENAGFTGGQSFALSIASIGFLVGSIVGVIYINVLKAKGKIKVVDYKPEKCEVEGDPEEEMPLSEPVDRLTMNLGIISMILIASYGFMYLFQMIVETGALGDFGTDTLLPLVFGFNFIFGTIFALIYKAIFKKIRKSNIAKHEYTDNQTLNRIGGFSFDLMIFSGVMLIDVSVMGSLILPLIIVCALGTVATFFYVRIACKIIYPEDDITNFLGFFGMLCGTASTGVTLIRLVDPAFKSQASGNLVKGSMFAVIIGFPLLTIVALAPENPWLVMGLIVLFGTIVNLILYRRLIFKKWCKPIDNDTDENADSYGADVSGECASEGGESVCEISDNSGGDN